MDLDKLFESLVQPLEQPEGRSLTAVPIPSMPSHRLAKDSGGFPCLLLHDAVSEAPSAPIRLQNLTVSYGVACAIRHPNGHQEEGIFTILKCSSADPALFPHFLRILSPIIAVLGPSPTAAAVRRAISGLVDLFRALTVPPRRSVQGLWAELLTIWLANDRRELVAAWHGDPFEHVDFLAGLQRIEVKSSSTRRRVHHFSLTQLCPPIGTQLLVASVFVESVGGGHSLRRISDEIRTTLAPDPLLLSRFDSILYATLGTGWSDAMEECFDLQLAKESLEFFDSVTIPKIEGPIAPTISDVRFTSDGSGAPPLTANTLRAAGGLFAAIVPER